MFVQKIASDSNKIITGISESVADEVVTQTDLIKDSMKRLDDKLFKWFCTLFIVGISALFSCSILSSTWASNKLLVGLRTIASTGQHNPAPNTKKVRHY